MGLGDGVMVLLPTTIRGTAADGKVVGAGALVVAAAETDAGTDC